MLFYAQTADCVFTNQPNPDTCEQQTAPEEFQIGKDQPSAGSKAQGYPSLPAPLGATAIGPDLGKVLAYTDVGWSALRNAFTFPGMAYVVILPKKQQ